MKHLSLFIIVSLGLMAGSCGNGPGRAGNNGAGNEIGEYETGDGTGYESGNCETGSDRADKKGKRGHRHSVSLDPTCVIDSLKTGKLYWFCKQTITSAEEILAAFPPETYDGYDRETTPTGSSFFVPEPDIKQTGLVKRVMVRYNYSAVFNKVLQGLELYERWATESREEPVTRQDTLAWIAVCQPDITPALLRQVLPDAALQKKAQNLLDAFRKYDGNWTDDCPLALASDAYMEADISEKYPPLYTEDMKASFDKGYWKWYDKARFVPEIDDIIRLNTQIGNDIQLTDEQKEHFLDAVLSETDIDRRTILALEYAKFDDPGGAVTLGDILESGVYTRYLFEAWLSWRTHVQMSWSVSSFSAIPNNYYDLLRVKCLNTLLRHWQETSDQAALFAIEDFVQAEILHRQASFYGNEALIYAEDLDRRRFIHPRISGEDYLNQE